MNVSRWRRRYVDDERGEIIPKRIFRSTDVHIIRWISRRHVQKRVWNSSERRQTFGIETIDVGQATNLSNLSRRDCCNTDLERRRVCLRVSSSSLGWMISVPSKMGHARQPVGTRSHLIEPISRFQVLLVIDSSMPSQWSRVTTQQRGLSMSCKAFAQSYKTTRLALLECCILVAFLCAKCMAYALSCHPFALSLNVCRLSHPQSCT